MERARNEPGRRGKHRWPTHELGRKSRGEIGARAEAVRGVSAAIHCGVTADDHARNTVAEFGHFGELPHLHQAVQGRLGFVSQGVTANHWLQLKFKAGMCESQLRCVVQYVRARLVERCPAVGAGTATYEESREAYERLPCPGPQRVPGEPEMSTSRYISHDAAMVAMLGSAAVQRELKFEVDGSGNLLVRSVMCLDHVNITKQSGATLGFSALLNMATLKNAPGAMCLSYYGEHKDDSIGAARATKVLLNDTTGTIKWGCCGASCAVPGCGHSAGVEHEAKHVCFVVDDFACCNAASGVDGQACWRCLRKKGDDWNAAELTEARGGDYRVVAESYVKAFDQWDKDESTPAAPAKSTRAKQWRASKQYQEWRGAERPGARPEFSHATKYHTGPNAFLSLPGELQDHVRQCCLHLVLSIVNKMFRTTWVAAATKLELSGQSGMWRLCEGMREAGFGWFATKMWGRYEDAMAAMGEAAAAGEDTTDAVDTTGMITDAKAQKRAGLYVSLVAKKGGVEMLKQEILSLGTPEPKKWPKKNELVPALTNNLARALRAGDIRWGDLDPSRMRLAGLQPVFDAHADQVGDEQQKLTLTEDQLVGIASEQIDLMGSDCVKLMSAWRVLIGYMDCNVTTTQVESAALQRAHRSQHAKLEQQRSAIHLRIEQQTKHLEDDTLQDETMRTLESELLTLSEAIEKHEEDMAANDRVADGSLAHLVEELADDLDDTTKNFIDTWEKLVKFLPGLHRGERFTEGDLQAKIDAWVAAWQAAGTEQHGLYVHYLRRHAAGDAKVLWDKYKLTLGDFTAQRSEHCNKLVKLRLTNLFAFKYGTGGKYNRTAAELVMVERLKRIIHFPQTIPRRAYRKCSICGLRGHRSDNKTYHPEGNIAVAAVTAPEEAGSRSNSPPPA